MSNSRFASGAVVLKPARSLAPQTEPQQQRPAQGFLGIVFRAGDVAVSVQVHAQAPELSLRIQDSGPGFNPGRVEVANHLGLVSMQERAMFVGAIFECISEPGKGTTIDVRFLDPR